MADDAVAKAAAKREQLAQRRKALGLNQEQLAELLDVDRTTVARWERGEAQPLPWIRPKLAKALKVSPERNGLGVNEERLGHYGVAARHYRQALAIAAEIGDWHTECGVLVNLGAVSLRQGRYRQAADHMHRALAMCRETGYRDVEARRSPGSATCACGRAAPTKPLGS